MDIVVEVLSQLETLTITKEALEATRLGKHVNELRRKAQDRHLAVRAKSLVKKWRELLLPPPTQNKTPPIPTIGEPPPGGGGHGGMNGGSSKPLVNGNGLATVNQSSYNRPSSRLTSPAANALQSHPSSNNKSILSPGLRTGVSSSSLPSSTSTSPGLSRPTTPINKHSPPSSSSHPASPTLLPVHQQQPGIYGGESVPRYNAANKRLRKEMEREEVNHEPKASLFDVIDGRINNGSSNGKYHPPPPAKRSRPNGLVSNSSNQNTSEFLLHHNNKDNAPHIANSNSLSSPPLQNCDNHSAKAAAAAIPPNNTRFTTSGNNVPLDSSQISTPSVSPQGSSLSPPTANVVMDNNTTSSSVKPLPGKRKLRGQRRSEDERRDDILKQQMQSATRSGVLSKVRTTQELVQELTHSRLSSPSLSNSKPSHINVTDVTQLNETKTELMNRFFDSQNHSANSTTSATDTVLSPPDSEEAGPPSQNVLVNNHSHGSSSSLSRSESATPIDRGVGGLVNAFVDSSGKETVEDVMARLPPIDTAAILAEIELEFQREAEQEEQDQDVEGLIPVKRAEVEVTDEMVNLLNDGHVESFNGNFGHNGEFKEWHEVVSKPSAEGDLLHILPYSVID